MKELPLSIASSVIYYS